LGTFSCIACSLVQRGSKPSPLFFRRRSGLQQIVSLRRRHVII
jgi:hypothetical protein